MTTEEILELKSDADQIMSIPGNTKGNSLKTDAEFIVSRQGQQGLSELEEALALLGYPITYHDIRGFDWHPEAQAVLGIFVAMKLFSWEEDDLFDMGYAAPATSLIVKMLMRFVSVEATFRQAPSVWGRHYDFGTFETVEFKKDKNEIVFRVADYPFFDYMDPYFDGFLTKTLELVTASSAVEVERFACEKEIETCREYKGTWE